MNFEDNLFTLLAILFGILYGVLAQRKQFCFSGSIKDFILFKHTRRTASLVVAISSVVIFTQLIAYFYNIDFTQTKYYVHINYLFIVIGGLMFGYGMMISDGCSSRHLIKLAQGDISSLYILITLGLFAYLTYSILSQYYDTIYTNKIIKYFTFDNSYQLSLLIILPILSIFLFKSLKKCKNFFQTLDGLAIGLLISIVWYTTNIISDYYFIEISSQSLSFVYPIGKLMEFSFLGFNSQYLIFPVLIVIGVLIGAFISSQFNKQYSKKYMCDISNKNPPKLFARLIGGAYMGTGGILSIGCTVGQGLSGVSTLSSSSFIAILSIYISAFFTAKQMEKKNALIACFVFDFHNSITIKR
jgi:uncharacterized membrane protein YedE/YeeE